MLLEALMHQAVSISRRIVAPTGLRIALHGAFREKWNFRSPRRVLELPPGTAEKQVDYMMCADLFPTGWRLNMTGSSEERADNSQSLLAIGRPLPKMDRWAGGLALRYGRHGPCPGGQAGYLWVPWHTSWSCQVLLFFRRTGS